ncbi:MAG: hypothetical protein QF824_05065 [Candidatus Woesearchaeota archaeon]|nr:hypothetical protein [Candidatus Woesearchaeota archaeon]MDP7180614.1 hypothetical protein [Candidatus Woesearchaeota archaeon]MDP7458451.1 hypothetical protein [Candidatus Woesearchaeota archaeon]
MISKKWLIVIIILVVLLILMILPIWCSSYYLPDQATQGVVEKTHCGSVFDLFLTF